MRFKVAHYPASASRAALCHSSVDNSFATGIGRRLDGWPNTDLNVGAIVALSPAFDGTNLLSLDRFSLPIIIVNHYHRQFQLNLTRQQRADFVEFLKSLFLNSVSA